MTGAFLSDALRQQALAEVRGQMLQDQIAKQVARQIIGQVAQQEIGGDMQSQLARGRAIERAQERETNREVGMTQLEMQKDIAERQKTANLIGSVAAATGALGSYLALKKPAKKEKEIKIPPPVDELETLKFMGLTPGMPLSDQVRGTDAYVGEILGL